MFHVKGALDQFFSQSPSCQSQVKVLGPVITKPFLSYLILSLFMPNNHLWFPVTQGYKVSTFQWQHTVGCKKPSNNLKRQQWIVRWTVFWEIKRPPRIANRAPRQHITRTDFWGKCGGLDGKLPNRKGKAASLWLVNQSLWLRGPHG